METRLDKKIDTVAKDISQLRPRVEKPEKHLKILQKIKAWTWNTLLNSQN